MTLQSSGIMSLDDIYNEAVAGGYTGGRDIQDLRNESNILWNPSVPQSPDDIIMPDDFYGRTAYLAGNLGTYSMNWDIYNYTGSGLPWAGGTAYGAFGFLAYGGDEYYTSWNGGSQLPVTPDTLADGSNTTLISQLNGVKPLRATNGNIYMSSIGWNDPYEFSYAIVEIDLFPFATWSKTVYPQAGSFPGTHDFKFTDYCPAFDAIYTTNKTFNVTIKFY